MRNTIAYIALGFIGLAAIYLWANNRQLNKEITQLAVQQESWEAWRRADSLYFGGDTLAAREAWSALGEALPGFRQAFEARIGYLDQASLAALQRAKERDSLLASIAAAARSHRASQAELHESKRNLRAAKASLADSLETLARESRRRESLAAERQQRLEEKVNELEGQVERQQILTFKSPGGVDIVYMGEAKEGQAHGYGIGVWANGTTYTGEWRQGIKHGKGKYEYPEGEKYEGEFVEDKREGFGVYTWKNGERYEGGWKNDLRHGQGAIIDNKGEVVRSGIWDNDRLPNRRRQNDALEDEDEDES